MHVHKYSCRWEVSLAHFARFCSSLLDSPGYLNILLKLLLPVFCIYSLLTARYMHVHKKDSRQVQRVNKQGVSFQSCLVCLFSSGQVFTYKPSKLHSKIPPFRLQREHSNSINSSCWEMGQPFPGAIHNI